MSLHVESLTKRFGTFAAVEDVSFDVGTGELVALLGPSGGGKSTILRVIAGLERPDSGRVYFAGESVGHLPARERGVGFVFQHYALFRHSTVAQNVGFGLDVQKVPPPERDARVEELLDLVGLHGMGARMPSQLSGGQRQRVALARALAPRPRFLLLDEPFAAVDARVRQELRSWLRRLHDELHVTSMLVTHDQEEAFALADRVAVIHAGRLEQFAPPLEIIDAPATEFVARFVGDANVLHGRSDSNGAWIGDVRVAPEVVTTPPVPSGSVHVIVRPYELKLWRDDTGPASVDRVTVLGDRVKVHLTVNGGQPMFAQFPRRSSLLQGVESGARVAVEVTRARVYSAG